MAKKKRIMTKYASRKDYFNMTVLDNVDDDATGLLIKRICVNDDDHDEQNHIKVDKCMLSLMECEDRINSYCNMFDQLFDVVNQKNSEIYQLR